MNIIFSISGGMGKSIMATAVCKAIKKQYPDSFLIVVTGHPDVFLNVPYVDMSFAHHQESYFYQKYVEGQDDVLVFANEPYVHTEHILKKEHTIATWCRMNNIIYNGEMPEAFLTEREFKFYSNKYASDKPIMAIQTNGGGQQDLKYSWARDMPSCVVEAIIDEFSHIYNIFHIRREDQIAYRNTIPIHDSYKGIATILAISQKRLLIDSFCQHLSAALNLKSTVLWIANSPKLFGYDLHDNILSNPETKKPDLRNAFLSKYNIVGALHEFPYNKETEIFNIDNVIESLKSR